MSEEKTYTLDEVDALVSKAVADATAPLQAELENFKGSQATAEVEAKIAEVRAELEAQVADLTSRLDAAVIEAEQAKTERDEITTFLTEETERVAQEAELETRTAARIEQVAAVVKFPEDYVAERASKWAALNDEEFEALLADYAALGGTQSETSPLPRATAMHASRTSDNEKVGAAASIIRGRSLGIDPRRVR